MSEVRILSPRPRIETRFNLVFFTSILIVIILYYLQSGGLIYVTVIALVAELINIFMTHTVTKAVEKRLTIQHRRILDGYKNRLKSIILFSYFRTGLPRGLFGVTLPKKRFSSIPSTLCYLKNNFS